MKVGVFDSGVGGLSVAKAVEAALPDAEVIFVNDTAHMPYATKSPAEIYGYIRPIFADLVAQRCDAIVVACNTVSTTLIQRLRQDFPSVPLIAMEPMIKPAAAITKSKVITVCATPTTLSSERYNWLKETYAADMKVLEPDCADWSYLIEHNSMNETRLRQEIMPALEAGTDVVVLGCTHYHWIENEIKELVGDKAIVLQPEEPVIKQLKQVLGLQP